MYINDRSHMTQKELVAAHGHSVRAPVPGSAEFAMLVLLFFFKNQALAWRLELRILSSSNPVLNRSGAFVTSY
jgi:hypothetical protein